MTDREVEAVARAIYWAAYETYPPGPENPVSRMTPGQAWDKSGKEQKFMSIMQAKAAIAALDAIRSKKDD